MRAFAIVAVAAVAVAAGTAGLAGAAGSSRHTALTVTFWDSGQRSSAEPDVWTLRCDPARGSLPNAALACKRLQAGGWRLVAPVPASAICTQIYGGPQVARVVGFLEGRRVWARFTRENGCQIGRWNRLSPWLFPAGAVK
jgi:hypothetical protein